MGAHLDPEDSAQAAGLEHVDLEVPGITRIRRGRGFEYRTPSGRRLTSKRQRTRVDALAIPPAWEDVWICPTPNGHIQAIGRDAEGRRQYCYHTRWDAERAADKFRQLGSFGVGLARIRRRAEADLADVPASKEAVTALVVAMLDRTLARIGGVDGTHESSSHGLTTLEVGHCRVRSHRVELHFEGKGGVERHLIIEDPALVDAVLACRALRGPTLFSYRSSESIVPITAGDVNERLGAEVSARDFRTWGATVTVVAELARIDPVEPSDVHAQFLAAVDVAAERLGNTRAVCRESYVHPSLEPAFETGALHEAWRSARSTRDLTRAERATIRLLSGLDGT